MYRVLGYPVAEPIHPHPSLREGLSPVSAILQCDRKCDTSRAAPGQAAGHLWRDSTRRLGCPCCRLRRRQPSANMSRLRAGPHVKNHLSDLCVQNVACSLVYDIYIHICVHKTLYLYIWMCIYTFICSYIYINTYIHLSPRKNKSYKEKIVLF